jgi:hypothetical protein
MINMEEDIDTQIFVTHTNTQMFVANGCEYFLCSLATPVPLSTHLPSTPEKTPALAVVEQDAKTSAITQPLYIKTKLSVYNSTCIEKTNFLPCMGMVSLVSMHGFCRVGGNPRDFRV